MPVYTFRKNKRSNVDPMVKVFGAFEVDVNNELVLLWKWLFGFFLFLDRLLIHFLLFGDVLDVVPIGDARNETTNIDVLSDLEWNK